mmetsp:Transcript_19553/g.29611  ORF Transcript_19553/g.29611 Transcript_19553/m.29611 type:complete len:367 (+) Transcript_19553:90-1190(+)
MVGNMLLVTLVTCLVLHNSSAIERRAFVTVITSDDAVEKAMVVGSTLRAFTRTAETTNSDSYTVDYICLVLPKYDYSDEFDSAINQGVELLGAKKLEFSGWSTKPLSYSISNPEDEGNGWNDVDFNIIWIWSLISYEKVIYLDTDLLVIQDIGDLFDLDLFTQIVPFAAAPKLLPSNKFDAGLMVIKPDITLFMDMQDQVKNGDVLSNGIEEFLNSYYSDWFALGASHRLVPIYNAPYAWTKDKSWEHYRSDVKIVRFSEEDPLLILKHPMKYKVSRYGAPLIYVYAIIMFFIANPLDEGLSSFSNKDSDSNVLEEETRYVMKKVFDVTKSSEEVAAYIEKMKRGGTRLRLDANGVKYGGKIMGEL